MLRVRTLTRHGLLLVLLAGFSMANAAGRFALVIGNASYAERPLTNPKRDADAMAALLGKLGFTTVIKAPDLKDVKEFRAQVNGFLDRSEDADVRLFYYSGHGANYEDDNYLLPTEHGVTHDYELPNQAYSVKTLLRGLKKLPGISLVLLDSCRDAPFSGDKKSLWDDSKGMKPLQPNQAGVLIGYAADQGQTASDNSMGANSLYTKHLLEQLSQRKGLREILAQVRQGVYAESDNKQFPMTEDRLLGDVYLAGTGSASPPPAPVPPPTPPASPPAVDHDLIAWQSAEKCGTAACFQAYLDDYPSGRYARMAKARLKPEPPPRPTTTASTAPAPVERPNLVLKPRQALKLGLIAELTGDLPAVGASCKNAAEMAVKEINAAGGLQVGKEKMKVQLVVEDNASKADQSAAAAQKLITQDEVLAIVGPNASRYAIPASEIAESSETVLIAPWSTNPKTTLDAATNQPKKYVFRACFIDPFQGGVLAKFALEKLKAKNAAVLYDVASDYNKGIAEVFKANYEKLGGKIVAFETYTTNDKDFSWQLARIRNARPDVILLPNYYSEVPLQVQQAKRLGINVPFIGSDAWGSNELLTLGGADLNGYYFSTHYAADNAAPVAKKFIEDYEKAYGAKPDDVAALTYDAFGLLFGAIKSAGKADREAIRDALSTLSNYQGVTGDIRFRAGSGDPIKSAVILQIRGGKFTFFTNANL